MTTRGVSKLKFEPRSARLPHPALSFRSDLALGQGPCRPPLCVAPESRQQQGEWPSRVTWANEDTTCASVSPTLPTHNTKRNTEEGPSAHLGPMFQCRCWGQPGAPPQAGCVNSFLSWEVTARLGRPFSHWIWAHVGGPVKEAHQASLPGAPWLGGQGRTQAGTTRATFRAIVRDRDGAVAITVTEMWYAPATLHSNPGQSHLWQRVGKDMILASRDCPGQRRTSAGEPEIPPSLHHHHYRHPHHRHHHHGLQSLKFKEFPPLVRVSPILWKQEAGWEALWRLRPCLGSGQGSGDRRGLRLIAEILCLGRRDHFLEVAACPLSSQEGAGCVVPCKFWRWGGQCGEQNSSVDVLILSAGRVRWLTPLIPAL